MNGRPLAAREGENLCLHVSASGIEVKPQTRTPDRGLPSLPITVP
jgi:hypothetical protein